MASEAAEAETWVAGVDGCPAGWLVVLRPLEGGEDFRAYVLARFADLLTLPEPPAIIAVDMPIGLPARSAPGGRACDIEARRGLGARQSAVFAVPARAAVMETDYRAACAAALARSDPPRKVSKQCFNLFGKMREVDAVVTPVLQDRIIECHPEAAFWAMNAKQALSEPKKVRSRPHPPGLDQRRALLRAQGFPPDLISGTRFPVSAAGADDLIDACACAWTAARVFRGTALRFPSDPPLDPRRLRMEIWA